MSGGRGKSAKSIQLINAAIEILEEVQPATVRAVCYRLFIRGLIPSMAKNHTNAVSTQLVWAREHGYLDWDWVVDETREPERIPSWDSPESVVAAAVRQYRKDHCTLQSRWVEIWSEKGTVRGTLAPVLEHFGVTFRVMHGYGSATTLHGVSQETKHRKAPLEILYVGDWDPSGLHMSEVDLRNRLSRYEARATVSRIALCPEDVRAGGLPSFDADSKRGDPRFQWYRDHFGSRCFELDAMSPAILRARVTHEIEARLDREAWEHSLKIEKAERDSMENILGDWMSISWQARNCEVRP